MFQQLRKRKGFTQEVLAKKIGVGQSAIAMWETGRATPSLATMQKVAVVLGCELIEVVNCFKEKEQ